mmetsp:Transcript_6493/g.16121  ORF Transcript_6493/g.16121 Transcript_6493/m.16121 type:complete len:210 (+) Transcript_6493:196-825(+)
MCMLMCARLVLLGIPAQALGGQARQRLVPHQRQRAPQHQRHGQRLRQVPAQPEQQVQAQHGGDQAVEQQRVQAGGGVLGPAVEVDANAKQHVADGGHQGQEHQRSKHQGHDSRWPLVGLAEEVGDGGLQVVHWLCKGCAHVGSVSAGRQHQLHCAQSPVNALRDLGITHKQRHLVLTSQLPDLLLNQARSGSQRVNPILCLADCICCNP